MPDLAMEAQLSLLYASAFSVQTLQEATVEDTENSNKVNGILFTGDTQGDGTSTAG